MVTVETLLRTFIHWLLITMKRLFGGMEQKCPKIISRIFLTVTMIFCRTFDIITDMGARGVMRNR